MIVESSHHGETREQVKEWYILVGIRGKTLQPSYVNGQFDAKKVTIRGTYSQEEILKYYQNGMITRDTILFKEGDAEWKPLERQELVKFDSVATRIADNLGLTGDGKDRLALRVEALQDYVRENWKFLCGAFAALLLVYLGYDYYYYQPEQIYERTKKAVVLITTEDGERQTTSLGSGFVVDKDGIIATNLHVISNAATIKIKSGADQSYDAEGVIYVDAINDLALLKIRKNEKDATVNPIRLGKADEVKVGEQVYAVGNPGGLEFSLSEGIVSGKRNEDPITKEARSLIQITAPISPGNSGGPILNKKGEVVGIATMGSRNGFQNLNFAVPVKVLRAAEKHQDMEYKFLPPHPKWTPVSTSLDYGVPDGASDTSPGGICFTTFYNDETISRHGNKTRAWIKALATLPSSGADDPYQGYESRNFEIVGLIEADCKQNIFRFNILTGLPDDDAPPRASFSETAWKPVGDGARPLFEKICNKR